MSALCYIKSTTKSNKFVIFSDSKSALHALLSKWDHPTVLTIMRFFNVFIYSDAYQYTGQYVRDLWQNEWDMAVNNKIHATKPLIREQPSAYRYVRRDEVVLS